MEDKIDRILWLLEDKELGLCSRVRKMEKVIYGNGEPGLAESVRVSQRNWAIVVFLISICTPIVYKVFF